MPTYVVNVIILSPSTEKVIVQPVYVSNNKLEDAFKYVNEYVQSYKLIYKAEHVISLYTPETVLRETYIEPLTNKVFTFTVTMF